ncbi:MAG TPA: glycosyltransferase family 4 protein [Solirubrobacteraceae bacterium]|nr:glycosyltransferase family 4 protein [Solirubrobacteraceae bacterium]
MADRPGPRVDLVDPAAYTPPYDHALAAALAGVGARVRLVTGPFAHGEVPRISAAAPYAVDERFYRWSPPGGARRFARLAQHVPDMLRYRRAAASGADVVHFQWLPVQPVDVHLLPPGRPRVLTAHDVLPREAGARRRDAQRRLYERMDAVVVHSEHGRRRLIDLGIDPARVEVIPHGAFTHLTELPSEAPLAPQLAAVPAEKPVVLLFGLLRPYKGLDVLLRAWEGIDDAELWIVGNPRGVTLPDPLPPGVRAEPRFVADAEIPALFRRADLVVLPYREIDQSGVLFTALAFGKPLILSDVGGFPEVAAHGAASVVPAGDAAALHTTLAQLLADPARRTALASASATAARDHYAWPTIAAKHLALYDRLLSTR